MFRRYRDLIAGILVDLFAVFVYYETFNIKIIQSLAGKTNATFFPRLVVIALGLLGTILIVQGALYAKSHPVDKNAANTPFKLSQGALCGLETGVCVFLYALAFKPVGFLLSTAVYLFLQMNILATKEQRKPILFAVIAVVVSAIVYFAFVKGFKLSLPAGILG